MSRQFDPVQKEYLHSAANAAYNNLNKATWAMWIFLNSQPGTPNHSYTFLVKDPTNTDTVFIGITNAGSPGSAQVSAFVFPPDGNWFSNQDTGVGATVGSWFHVVVTYDESQSGIGPGALQIYINGVLPGTEGSSGDTPSSSPVDDSGDGYYIGNDTFGTNGGVDGNMDGKIAEVVIFPNVVLTPTQITNLYNSTTGVPGGFPAEAAYWHLCGTASPEPDVSGNGLSMALSVPAPIQGSNSPGFTCPGGTIYVPFDTVEYLGSTYVCIVSTSSSPVVAPSSWVQLSQGAGSINNSLSSGNYLAVNGDYGKLLTNTSASAYTLTLPATPPRLNGSDGSGWWIAVQNSGTGSIVINSNGLSLDGVTSATALTLNQSQGVLIFTDGVNYFTQRGVTSGPIKIVVPFSTASVATTRLIDAEPSLTFVGSTTIIGSIAGVRGNITQAAGNILSSGYEYGVQGKLTLAGTLANGSGFNAGIFGQIDTSNAAFVHTSGYLAPIMGDFGATSIMASDANANMISVLNTTNCIINSALQFIGNAKYAFDLTDLAFGGAHFVATQTGIATLSKSLKVHVDGTDFYIPLCTGTT